MAGHHAFYLGGNAIDAAAAVGFAISVVEPHNNTIGGEVPMLLYSPKDERVVAISGQGPAPERMTIEWFRSMGIPLIPGDGLLAATVPATVSAWITVLKEYGRLSLKQVLEPAIQLAESGFSMYGEENQLHGIIASNAETFLREYPTTARVFLPGGRVPDLGEVFRQPDLALTFRRLVEAERMAIHKGRTAGLEAANDLFYRGEIAQQIEDFVLGTKVMDSTGDRHGSFLTKEDLGRYSTRIEEPVCIDYKEQRVCKCGPWSQGPVFLETLKILEGYDLAGMGHNSVDYLHVLIEAFKLAYADREMYYGDPLFDSVPLDLLLSEEYSEQRRRLVDMNNASSELTPGNVAPHPGGTGAAHDTVHLDVVDKEGYMVSATQSGAWISSSPLIGGLGFPLGTRAQMFYLDPGRNNSLRPGKRPRTTLTPSLVTDSHGRPLLAFGTPGGDMQDQWTLQFYLNFAEFGMSMQEATEAPLMHSLHFPSSFYPREAFPRRVVIEDRVGNGVIEELRRRGHDVEVVGPWGTNCRVTAVSISPVDGTIRAAASPRTGVAYAITW